MRKFLVLLVAFSFLSVAALASGKSAPSKRTGKGGISDATVSAAVKEFVDSLNSMEDDRVLAAITPADRGALKGRDNLIGLVAPKKLTEPKVASFEKVVNGGKTIGVTAKVTVDETDPIDGMKAPKERTWFLALDGSNQLKVSVSSVWLDAEMVREP